MSKISSSCVDVDIVESASGLNFNVDSGREDASGTKTSISSFLRPLAELSFRFRYKWNDDNVSVLLKS